MLKIKNSVLSLASRFIIDRHLTSVFIVMILLALAVTIYMLLRLHPSELQLVSRYSSFGTTHFYREQWFYLFLFAAFAWVVAFAHIALSRKTYDLSGRPMALVIAWLGVSIIILDWITAESILNIWSPL